LEKGWVPWVEILGLKDKKGATAVFGQTSMLLHHRLWQTEL
jgi:hypothetical protein